MLLMMFTAGVENVLSKLGVIVTYLSYIQDTIEKTSLLRTHFKEQNTHFAMLLMHFEPLNSGNLSLGTKIVSTL